MTDPGSHGSVGAGPGQEPGLLTRAHLPRGQHACRLGAAREGLLLPVGWTESLIKAWASDPWYTQSFTLNMQCAFCEGHLWTISGVKWVQFSKRFL